MHSTHDASTSASIENINALRDDELLANTQRLLIQERKLSARLLVYVAEVDARQLYRPHAYSSMFEYCVKALHMSEEEAYLRISAARLGRRFPRALQMFAAGELHLTALKLLAPVLDEGNCEELLSVSNIRVLCRSHNALLAEWDFGRAFVRKQVERALSAQPHELGPDQVHRV